MVVCAPDEVVAFESTREAWLGAATDRLRPVFRALGYTIPDKIRFAIAFPSAGARGKAVGECWQPEASEDGHYLIHIRADQSDPVEVLAVLVHELIHASLPFGTRHGPVFRKAATALGLIGPMRSTVAGPELKECLNALCLAIGPLPHGKLNFNHGADDRPPKQPARLLKAQCPRCGYIIRLARIWAEVGLPTCPREGHGEFVCEAL